MRKCSKLVWVLVAVMLFCGCGEGKTEDAVAMDMVTESVEEKIQDVESETAVNKIKTEEEDFELYIEYGNIDKEILEQLALFAQYYEEWYWDDGYLANKFMVLDMDDDGKLELITNVEMGSGIYSENEFFQAEDGKLVKLEQVFIDPRITISQFDIGYSTWTSYVDEESGKIYYAGTDHERDGISYCYESEGAYWLENGVVYHEYIRLAFLADEGEGYVTTYYADTYEEESKITETEWEQLYLDYKEGKLEKDIKISWQFFGYDETATEGTVLQKLVDSYEDSLVMPYAMELGTELDVYKQLVTLAETSDMWLGFYNENDAVYEGSFAVCDLDEDGELELINAMIQGTGRFSYNSFYGVRDEAVIELSQPNLTTEMGEDEFDIKNVLGLKRYYDSETQTYYLEVEDYMRGGAAYAGYREGFMWLKEDEIYYDVVRSREYIWEEEEKITYYEGKCFWESSEITQEEWSTLRDEFTEGMTESETAFSWFTLTGEEAQDQNLILKKLAESYKEGTATVPSSQK